MALTEEELDALARAPKKVTGDEGSVEERSAKDFIEFNNYREAGKIGGPPYGMRIARVMPMGTVPPV